MKLGNDLTCVLSNSLNEDYKVLDKTQVKLFPNFTSIPFEYLYISWVTSYVSNVGFLVDIFILDGIG